MGWWVLAGLIALAGLAVLGQAAARQFSTDIDDHDALSALGLRGRQFVLLGLARAFVIGLAGAAGAVALAAALSPLTPVGEARLAAAVPDGVGGPIGRALGVPAVVAAVLLLSVWPAMRHARRGPAEPLPPAGAGPVRGPRGGRGRRAAQRAHRRPVRARTWPGPHPGPGGERPARHGAGGRRAVRDRRVRGQPDLADQFARPVRGAVQAEVRQRGDRLRCRAHRPAAGQPAAGPAIDRITLAAVVEINVNGRHVRAVAVTAVRGPALISAVDGRLPRGDQDIMLGAATLRGLGARPGTGPGTVNDPVPGRRTTRFRVTGRASFAPNFGTGGLGNGAALTVSACCTRSARTAGPRACARRGRA